MSIVKRNMQINQHGYCEVTLEYRQARISFLDMEALDSNSNRISCPMVEASRNRSAYGCFALHGTEKKHIKEWSEAIGFGGIGLRVVAYLSGRLPQLPGNFIRGCFDDQVVNESVMRSFKNKINTGMLQQGRFSSDAFNKLVWFLYPEFEGVKINSKFLYSAKGDELYIDQRQISKVIAYNQTNGNKNKIKAWLGTKISVFEMTKLLVGVLAQNISLDANDPGKKVKAILIRDVYDLYKYGWVPIVVEEKLHKAGLINLDPLNQIDMSFISNVDDVELVGV